MIIYEYQCRNEALALGRHQAYYDARVFTAWVSHDIRRWDLQIHVNMLERAYPFVETGVGMRITVAWLQARAADRVRVLPCDSSSGHLSVSHHLIPSNSFRIRITPVLHIKINSQEV